MWDLKNGKLNLNGSVVLDATTDIKSILCDDKGGAYITVFREKAAEENVYNIGNVQGAKRYMSCFRKNPYFMESECGDDLTQVKPETTCLLILKEDGRYLLMLPIFDKVSSGALKGGGKGLEVVAITGCNELLADQGQLLYICEGENPYDMMQNAAVSLKAHLGTFKLREEKALPALLNGIGWCTWNAFYFDVDTDKIINGLKEFKDNNFKLGFLLLDDGWITTTQPMPRGSRRVTTYKEDAQKFPRGFKNLISTVKKEYGVGKFVVWHASMGYWAGTKVDGFYKKKGCKLQYSSALSSAAQEQNKRFLHYPIIADKADKFFDGWHSYLSSVGVDGVKIDVQCLIEGLAHQAGGRVKSMDKYHGAIEKSVYKNFKNNCLNCMSCSTDMLYHMENTNALRSGGDWSEWMKNYCYIKTNAYNTFWMHPIAYPDWDMFWSNREESYIEAIARVASGGPIYVSDEPGNHDFELMRTLCLDDGTLLRATQPGRPTIDCLFDDDSVLKVFNTNKTAGIIGAFNFKTETQDYTISPSDINGICGDKFIVFGYKDPTIYKMGKDEKVNLTFAPESADLYTVSEIINGAAVMGICGKINASAAVESFNFENGVLKADVVADGQYRFYCEQKPERVVINGVNREFTYGNNIVEI